MQSCKLYKAQLNLVLLNRWSFSLCSSCVDAFNVIYKYSLFAFYVYIMLLLSCSLVTLQYLLVEYGIVWITTWKLKARQKTELIYKIFQWFSLLEVGRWSKCYRDSHNGDHCILGIRIEFLGLWTWPMGNQWICSVRWWAFHMRLVCIAYWNATIVFDFFNGHSTAAAYSKLCGYCMLTG